MIYRIALKNFKNNYKNYIQFFLSYFFSIALIFSFLYIKESLFLLSKGVESNAGISSGSLSDIANSAIVIITIITTLLMMFAMKHYIKTRVELYGVFLILGIRRKMLNLFIIVECFFCWIISLISGLCMGNILLIIFRQVLNCFVTVPIVETSIIFSIYRLTVLYSVVLFILIIFASSIFLEGKDLTSLLQADVAKESRPVNKAWWVLVMIGIALITTSVYITGGLGSESKLIPTGLFIVGLYITINFGGSLVLESMKKREKYYYKHLLEFNEYYYRFKNTKTIMVVVTFIHFIAIYNFMLPLVDNLPTETPKNWYPHDVVWMANKEDMGYIKNFDEKYCEKSEYIPMVRVTELSGGEHIGISESEYNKKAINKVDLEGKEILVDYQWDKTDMECSRIDASNIPPRIYIGKFDMKLWDDPNAVFEDSYKVVKEDFDIPFGYFVNPHEENIVVFSDEYFESILKKNEEPSMLVLQKVKNGKQESAVNNIKNNVDDYQKWHAKLTVYCKADLSNEKHLIRILNVMVNIFIIIVLSICSIVILYIKIFSNINFMKRKYTFLSHMGMRQKQKRKTITKELTMVFTVPLILGVFTGGCFVIKVLYERMLAVSDWQFYLSNMIVILGIYALVQFVALIIVRSVLIKKVESTEYSNNSGDNNILQKN